MNDAAARERILRRFVTGHRITQMPAGRANRLLVLEHVVQDFEPGLRYPEPEVDAILRAWFDDHAALRRYLVDEALLERRDGEYWRIGGPVLIR